MYAFIQGYISLEATGRLRVILQRIYTCSFLTRLTNTVLNLDLKKKLVIKEARRAYTVTFKQWRLGTVFPRH